MLFFLFLLAVPNKLPHKDLNHVPSPPPRKDSFHFSPSGTNPPPYSSLITLANDLSPTMLTFFQNDRAVLKESYTVNSTSSNSYSEKSANPNQPLQPPTVPNQISCCGTSVTTDSQVQERKVSSLKLTPLTVPDPPAHIHSYADPRSKTQSISSPPPTPPPPKTGPTESQPSTQTILLSVGPEKLKHQDASPAKPTVELKVANQPPGLASFQTEMTKAPPAVPPRPSAAELLVHN